MGSVASQLMELTAGLKSHHLLVHHGIRTSSEDQAFGMSWGLALLLDG